MRDRGVELCFTYEDLLRHHGPHSPGGVAHAFQVLARALPLLSPTGPPERREIVIRTAFGGPGARDGFELVTRAVTEGRYAVDPGLARPERGRAAERFVFTIGLPDAEVTLTVRDGIVSDEFIILARRDRRSEAEEARLDLLKREMAERVMGLRPEEVYDVDADDGTERRGRDSNPR